MPDVTPIIIKPTIRCRVVCLMPCLPSFREAHTAGKNSHQLRTHVKPWEKLWLVRRCLESGVWVWKVADRKASSRSGGGAQVWFLKRNGVSRILGHGSGEASRH